jgi:hypothetical protein
VSERAEWAARARDEHLQLLRERALEELSRQCPFQPVGVERCRSRGEGTGDERWAAFEQRQAGLERRRKAAEELGDVMRAEQCPFIPVITGRSRMMVVDRQRRELQMEDQVDSEWDESGSCSSDDGTDDGRVPRMSRRSRWLARHRTFADLQSSSAVGHLAARARASLEALEQQGEVCSFEPQLSWGVRKGRWAHVRSRCCDSEYQEEAQQRQVASVMAEKQARESAELSECTFHPQTCGSPPPELFADALADSIRGLDMYVVCV